MIDDLTKKFRIDFDEYRKSGTQYERPLTTILGHTLLSVVNVPVNLIAFTVSTVALLILGTLFTGKALVIAVIEKEINIPLYTGKAFEASVITLGNALTDIGENVLDVFVIGYKVTYVAYKVAKYVGITTAIYNLGALLAFIPKAFLGIKE